MIGFLSKLLNAMSNKKYRRNPHAVELMPEQQRALNVGAINAEQTMCYCDSLETGCNRKMLKKSLLNYYGVRNREEALVTLTWLSDRGHSVLFDAIKRFSAGMDCCIDDSHLEDEEKPNTYEYINHLKETADILEKKGCIHSKADFATCSIKAFDMGRLVLVARCSYDCGYITDTEAWEHIFSAYKKCQIIYNDWQELARGYIIGRSMQGGENITLGGIMGIADELLHDPESPWQKSSLR